MQVELCRRKNAGESWRSSLPRLCGDGAERHVARRWLGPAAKSRQRSHTWSMALRSAAVARCQTPARRNL